jgi:glycosyltransferase involved in cell wall biosynthesis
MSGERNICLIYLGRSGAGPQLTGDLFFSLQQRNIKTFVVLSRFNKENNEIPENSVLRLSTYRSVFGLIIRFLILPLHLISLVKFLKRNQINCIIFPMNTPLSQIIQIFLKLQNNFCIPILHDAVRHPGDPYRFPTKILTSLEIKFSSKVIFLNQVVAKQFNLLYKVNQDKCINLFLPIPNVGRTSHKLFPKSKFRVLFFGRIVAYKGIDLLLKAFEISYMSNPEIELCICGSGDFEFRDSHKGVTIINRYICKSEICDIFESSNALILPYVEATQSGVAALAVAYGLPIISTPIESLKEQLKNYGVIFSDNVSAISLSKCITQLSSSSDIYSNLAKMQTNICTDFSWSAFTNKLLNEI